VVSGLVTVRPIYGNGWTDGIRTIETPGAFEVVFSRKGDLLTGKVESEHDYAGWHCQLTQRHARWNGCVNVELTGPNGRVHGYAEIPAETLS
jgi:hypothetical protein